MRSIRMRAPKNRFDFNEIGEPETEQVCEKNTQPYIWYIHSDGVKWEVEEEQDGMEWNGRDIAQDGLLMLAFSYYLGLFILYLSFANISKRNETKRHD